MMQRQVSNGWNPSSVTRLHASARYQVPARSEVSTTRPLRRDRMAGLVAMCRQEEPCDEPLFEDEASSAPTAVYVSSQRRVPATRAVARTDARTEMARTEMARTEMARTVARTEMMARASVTRRIDPPGTNAAIPEVSPAWRLLPRPRAVLTFGPGLAATPAATAAAEATRVSPLEERLPPATPAPRSERRARRLPPVLAPTVASTPTVAPPPRAVRKGWLFVATVTFAITITAALIRAAFVAGLFG